MRHHHFIAIACQIIPTIIGCSTERTRENDTSTAASALNAQKCWTCMRQDGAEIQACLENAACNAWLGCVRDCGLNDPTPSCRLHCDAEHVDAKPMYDKAYAYSCKFCRNECSVDDDFCSHLGGMP
jgi:hypothetical protein